MQMGAVYLSILNSVAERQTCWLGFNVFEAPLHSAKSRSANPALGANPSRISQMGQFRYLSTLLRRRSYSPPYIVDGVRLWKVLPDGINTNDITLHGDFE